MTPPPPVTVIEDESKIRIRRQQQLTVQEALLAAALRGGTAAGRSASAAGVPGRLLVGGGSQPFLPLLFHHHQGSSHLASTPKTSTTNDAATATTKTIQDLLLQSRIQSLTNAAVAAATTKPPVPPQVPTTATDRQLSLLLGISPALIAASRGQRQQQHQRQQQVNQLERLNAVRQQVLALTDDNPFTSTSSSGSGPADTLAARILAQQSSRVVVPEQQQRQQNSAAFSSQSQSMIDRDGTLKALGSSMRTKNSPYIDASSLSDPNPQDLARRRTRGGVTEPFPEKLHRMLEEASKDGDEGIVSFFSHGRAFGVHDPERFVSKIMPKYFKQSRLSSFQRQLNLYGFVRISNGPDAGGYYHELFLKNRPALCIHMRRVGIPQGEDRRKTKSGVTATTHMIEPDFYSMKKLEETPIKNEESTFPASS